MVQLTHNVNLLEETLVPLRAFCAADLIQIVYFADHLLLGHISRSFLNGEIDFSVAFADDSMGQLIAIGKGLGKL
jgi:hypothetical protein